MGWYTSYTLKLDKRIKDFDYDYVDFWCSQQDNFTMVDYDTRSREILVEIKYGREDILNVKDMIEEKFDREVVVTSITTDETEWPDWKEFIRDQHLYV
jgi:hypothetical protein